MKNLKIGDMVQVARGEFEPVYSFGLKNASSTTEFLHGGE
jgi:hypothetical protein